LQNARALLSFLAKAVIVGLALAFLVVWWRPTLLAAPPATAPPPAQSSVAAARPVVIMQSFADSVARAAPAVVNIYTRRVVTERQSTPLSQFFGDYFPPAYRNRVENSLGSGVIVDTKGTIVTNHHVIAGAQSIQVQLADGRVADATVVGSDPDTDIAILGLKIDKLPSISLGRSDTLRVGDIVLAIGNPYGIGQTVTQGIVSATGRGQLGLATFENFIQTDAAINLGNSGGALIDAQGELVGINTAVLNRQYGGPEGIGFAIPVNLVRGVMEQILTQGYVTRGWLGFLSQDLSDQDAQATGAAVVVVKVLPGSPAAAVGIQADDLITALNGEPVHSSQELVSRLAAIKPGTEVRLEGRRGRQPFKLKLEVIERTPRPRQQEGNL
jgi:Do/DeqQ family serine protease